MVVSVPTTCPPDRHLPSCYLQELFDNFNTAITNSHPPELIFTSLVRLAYSGPLSEAKQETAEQAKEHAREIAKLKLECEILRDSISDLKIEASVKNASKDTEEESGKSTLSVGPSETKNDVQLWPATPVTIYISSHKNHGRRDNASFSPETNTFTPRMSFKAFKFEEPGTVKIYVVWQNGPFRTLAVLSKAGLDQEWKEDVEFWAYNKPRPGTEMIWIGFRKGPDRGIFVKGDDDDMMEGWERKFRFWVPI